MLRDVPNIEMSVYEHRDKAMPREEIKSALSKGCDGLLCLLTDKIDAEMVSTSHCCGSIAVVIPLCNQSGH